MPEPLEILTSFPLPVDEADALLKEMECFCRWFLERRNETLGRERLTGHDLKALKVVIALHGSDVSTAAKQLDRSGGQASRILKSFAKRGWVNLEARGKDRRQHLLEVTNAGREKVARSEAQLRHLVERIMMESGKTKKKRERILKALQDLNINSCKWQQELADDVDSETGKSLEEKKRRGYHAGKRIHRQATPRHVHLTGAAGVEVRANGLGQ